MAQPTPPHGPSPEAIALDIAMGGWRAKALSGFITSGLADTMKTTEFVTPETLAKSTDLDADAVHRLVRFLSTIGVCVEEDSGGRFALGPVGEVCTKDHPSSVRGGVLLETGEQHNDNMWRHFPEYLRTGKKVTKSALGKESYWDMCESNPEHLKIFQEAMSSYSNDHGAMLNTASLSPTFDLSGFGSVCDLGGAEGRLCRALAERFPDCKYIAADLPHIVARLDPSAVPDNVEIATCDFFKADTIPVADAYILKFIIHDWDDAPSIDILKNIRSVSPGAKVFLIEFGPMPGPNVPHHSKLFDLHMAILFNGHERTPDEYANVFTKSGYKLDQVHLLAGGNYPLYVQEIGSQ